MSSSVRPGTPADNVIPEPTDKRARRLRHVTPTAKYVEVNVYNCRGVIGESRGAAGAGEPELLPIISQRSIHPDVAGQRTVGEFPSKYHHVPLPLHGGVGVPGHLETVKKPQKLKEDTLDRSSEGQNVHTNREGDQQGAEVRVTKKNQQHINSTLGISTKDLVFSGGKRSFPTLYFSSFSILNQTTHKSHFQRYLLPQLRNEPLLTGE